MGAKLGRNDPCSCGSGKKYKSCCLGKSESRPSTPDELGQLVALFNAGRYAELESRTRLLVEQYPDSGLYWKALGASLQVQGKEALPALEKAAELLPNDVEAHYNLGQALKGLGHLNVAEGSYRRVLKIRPEFAEAHYALGAVLQDLGRLDDAMTNYRQALKIKPNYAEAQSNLGVVLQGLGRLAEAEASLRRALKLQPAFAEAHSNLGNVLKDCGHSEGAVVSYQRALEIKPNFAEAHYNLGTVLQDSGQLDDAMASYRRALEIKPDYAAAHSNLGAALQECGRLVEAEASLSRALELNPDFAAAHSNLGNVLNDRGQLEAAVTHYSRALALNPDYAEVHSNLGAVLMTLGRQPEAELSLRRALELNPDLATALNSLALLLMAQGETITALSLIQKSLCINETAEAKGIFIDCLKRLPLMQVSSALHDVMVRALSEPWGRPGDLASLAAALVKLEPVMGECVARAMTAWPQRLPVQDLFSPEALAEVSSDMLLRTLLDAAPVCDIELERFLTLARHALLEVTAVASGDEALALNFYAALARQCFINEYVFACTESESERAHSLRAALIAALETNAPVPTVWLVGVAAYFPLHSLPCANRLLDRTWPDAVNAVLVQQVREPAAEQQYYAAIPRLTVVEDAVSLRVQDQYESNPYPRWIKAAPIDKPRSIDGYLRHYFPMATFQPFNADRGVEILIAGCGTGQQSIETAQRFLGARVLAIDLSMASLCYASRKTHALGLTMIEYAQADILKLESLGRSFDIIESSGVLHHLGDPLSGWRVLLSLLRPGGFMRLGFYSEVARRDVVRARAFIAEQGYGQTAADIRQCRQQLLALDASAGFEALLKLGDFFSVSACRDLLFHVQEQRMTLTDIEAFLRDNDLQFLGFQLEAQVREAYRRRFPDDRAATNLGYWQIFEVENPDIFIGMYQFWVQKTG